MTLGDLKLCAEVTQIVVDVVGKVLDRVEQNRQKKAKPARKRRARKAAK